MEENQNHSGKITPAKALKMLTDEGMNVTLEQATEILSFLKLMAEGVVKKFLEDTKTSKIKEIGVLQETLEIKEKKTMSKTPNKKTIYCNTCNFLNNSF
ncbi:hypothetical protein [Flavobacterium sp. UBA4854]|uniref:hypothetical protein n=1 Tax=Flavobacterium sp. UBA4854 TaxID=1946548 RepID=UPI00257A1EFB|nr:hypothetical protein [Flavobacterium sp. UBA4854]